MNKMKLKIDKREDIAAFSSTNLRRNYQHIAIEQEFSSTAVTSSFMTSLSNFTATLTTLSLRRIDIPRDSFIRCISSFSKLKELTLDVVNCTNDGIKHRPGMFNAPKLTSLVVKNCQTPGVVNALILLNIKSCQVEFSYCNNVKPLYDKFIAQQSCMESFIVARVWRKNIEHLVGKMVDSRVHYTGLKKVIVLDNPDDGDYYYGPDNLKEKLPAFLTAHKVTLREFHLENLMDINILRVIVNDLQLESLGFRELKVPIAMIAELRSNSYLKKLCNESSSRLHELATIFPSVVTLKTKFLSGESMDVLGDFKCLSNLWLGNTRYTKFDNPTMVMPTLKAVAFSFENFPAMQLFLECNYNSIDTLVIVELQQPSIVESTPNEILQFFSRFNRIVLSDGVGCRLAMLDGYDTTRYANEGTIEVRSAVLFKAKRDFGENSAVVKLFRSIPDEKIVEMEEMFAMNLGVIQLREDRKAQEEDMNIYFSDSD